jgi:hypothetical protein
MPIAGSFTGAFAFKSLSDQLIGYQTFNYTGADQLFTVPDGINLITVRMWGAGGGSNRAATGTIEAAEGGPGGFVKFKILVTPFETLTLKVGGGGNKGFNDDTDPGSGGGMSAVLRSSTYLGIAGAGGGSGGYGSSNNYSAGGAGGGLISQNGQDAISVSYSTGGRGGTQLAGGLGGFPGPGQSGSYLQGGNGPGSNLNNLGGWPNGGACSTDSERGGAGGGGYYGGGGGGGSGVWGAGGGGGSSYTDPAVYDVIHTTGITGNTTPPAITEIGYQSGIAVGGLNNTPGGNGLIYISW